jgi:hypothetical protein
MTILSQGGLAQFYGVNLPGLAGIQVCGGRAFLPLFKMLPTVIRPRYS